MGEEGGFRVGGGWMNEWVFQNVYLTRMQPDEQERTGNSALHRELGQSKGYESREAKTPLLKHLPPRFQLRACKQQTGAGAGTDEPGV